MWEEFANDLTTPLHTTVNNTTTSIIPNSETSAPSRTPFRIIIDSEIMMVTAGLGTGTWTVLRAQEGTIAASHTAGATIQMLLTKGMLEFLRDRMPVVDYFKYGAKADASSDNHNQMNSALADLNATYPNGCILMAGKPGDIFYYTSAFNMQSNVLLWLPFGVKHLRNWADDHQPLVSNPVSGAYLSKTGIIGLGTIGSVNSSMSGPIIYLHAHDLWLQDFTVDTFTHTGAGTAGQALVISGDRTRAYTVKTINPGHTVGTGGFRVTGGRNGRAFGLHIESGDDALQFVPVAPGNGAWANEDIEDWYYLGCTGISYNARGMVALLGDGGAAGGMSDNIRDVGWTDCTVFGGNRILVIANDDSSGEISDVSVRGGSSDGSLNTNATIQDVWMENNGSAYGGRVHNIAIRDHKFKHFYKRGIHIAANVTDVDIDVPFPDAPSLGASLLEVDGATRVRAKFHGTYDATPAVADVILIGGGAGANVAADVEIEITGNIINIPSGQWGINANGLNKGKLHGGKFSGAGNGVRIGLAANCSLIDVYDFDWSGITGTKYNDSATDTRRWNNIGDPATNRWWPPGYIFMPLATNFDFTNTATQLNINAMAIPLVGGGFYRVRAVIVAQGDANADIRLKFTAPTGSNWIIDAFDGLGIAATGTSAAHLTVADSSPGVSTSGYNFGLVSSPSVVPTRIVFDGYLQCGANGNLVPNVQQNVQTAVTCTVLAGSFVEAQRIG